MIRPCLTFVDRAEEAVKLYVSVFPNSKIVSMQRVESDGGPIPKGKLLNATFQLDGREYVAFDGGPTFTFTEGISLMVMCKTQQEVDRYWTKLTEGGGEGGPCGWLKATRPVPNQHSIRIPEVTPPRRLTYKEKVNFTPDVDTYEVETVIHLEQVRNAVRMVLTFESMHDDHWTKLAVMGREGELVRLAKVLAARQ